MRLQVGKCYALTSDGRTRRFRVIRNINNERVYVRYCGTDIEEEFFTETVIGGLSSDFKLIEIDCLPCDGKPSL